MANLIASIVQDLIKTVMDSLLYMSAQIADIEKLYFTKVSGDIAGLTGGDPVTVTTKLTKDDLIAGITLIQQVDKYFGNENMITSDYYGTLIRLINGDNSATGEISPSTEVIGEDLKSLAETLIDINQKCSVIFNMYNDNELNDIIANIESARVVYGATITVSLYSDGITLIEQFSNFVGNVSVITGDYASTINQWQAVDLTE